MPTDNETETLLPISLSQPSQPLWRSRDYVLLWSGQAISSIGTGVSQFALPLFILLVTKSPAVAGLIAAMRAFPYFAFTLPAGALVDRWDRKHVMMVCDAGRALCLISLPLAMLLASLTFVQLVVVALVEGTLYVFFDQASTASLPNVVSPEQLPAATGQFLAIDSMSTLVGSPLGGLWYALGQLFPFVFDACSYVLSVLSLLFLQTPFQQKREQQVARSLVKEIGDGLRWFWSHPLLRALAMLTGGINFIFPTCTLLVLQLAVQQHTSSIIIGLLFTAGGIGTLCGALLSSVFSKRLSLGLLIRGICWGLVVAWLLLGLTAPLVVLALSLSGLMLLRNMYAGVQFTYRLSQIPNQMLGRVNSAFRLIALGSTPVGLALGGLLIQWRGAIGTVFIFAGGLLVLAGWTTLSPVFSQAHSH